MGEPRIVSQQYLGSADEVVEAVRDAGRTTGAGPAQRFGIWRWSGRDAASVDVAGIVDQVSAATPTRPRRWTGILALGAGPRPWSPTRVEVGGFADWWRSTAGGGEPNRAAVDHRRFWTPPTASARNCVLIADPARARDGH